MNLTMPYIHSSNTGGTASQSSQQLSIRRLVCSPCLSEMRCLSRSVATVSVTSSAGIVKRYFQVTVPLETSSQGVSLNRQAETANMPFVTTISTSTTSPATAVLATATVYSCETGALIGYSSGLNSWIMTPNVTSRSGMTNSNVPPRVSPATCSQATPFAETNFR